MNVFFLALKSLWYRRFTSGLTVVAIALSVALFIGVGKIKDATQDAFSGAISRVDLIVGPRTGNLSLLLYSVFHVGYPSHNVSMKAVDYVKSNDQVEWVVPFSLGDGFKGFPVVGTTTEFFSRYQVKDGESIKFSQGVAFAKDSEAVIGGDVAQSQGLKVGDKIILSHGHSEEGDGFEKHDEHPFTVVGITQFTGTPIDRSVYVSLEGLGSIHDIKPASKAATTPDARGKHQQSHDHESEHDDHSHDHGEDHGEDHEHDHEHDHASFASVDGKVLVKYVSGFFVGAKSRMSSLALQRTINTWEEEALLAIMPGVAMAELWKNLSIFEVALSIISVLVVLAGMIGLFVSLLILSSQRRHEMVVLRAIGAGPSAIFTMLAGEAVAIVLAAIITGMGGMYLGILALRPWLEKKFAVDLALSGVNFSDMKFSATLLVVGAVVGIVSSIRTYRTAMHEGLTTKF